MAAPGRWSVPVLVGCVAAVLAAAGLLHRWTPSPAPPPAPVAKGVAQSGLPSAPFQTFLDFLRVDAEVQGVPRVTFDAIFAGMTADPEVIELMAAQPEYVKTAGDYISTLVSEARLATGRSKLVEETATLAAVEATYGVDRHVVLAIWGIESNFGGGMGVRSVLRSLATLAAFDSRRPEFWRNELLAALKIAQAIGDGGGLAGSWAGAMGHTQFMPTTYLQHAVDFDGDGRRDIWASVADALGSTANYLKASG